MKPVRKMLHIPSDPRGQRPVLVVLIHGSEVAPLRIAAQQLDRARLKIDAKPLPQQQKQTNPRWRTVTSQPRPQPARRKKQTDESGFEQHAIRLVAGKILS